MTPRARTAVSAFVAIFVAVHLCIALFGNPHWPVVGFRMFAFNLDEPTTCPVVYGVTADGEFAIHERTTDWSGTDFAFAMKKMLHYPRRNPHYAAFATGCADDACTSHHMLEATAPFLFEQYKQLEGLPPLQALRIYEVEYQGSPDGFTIRDKHLLLEAKP